MLQPMASFSSKISRKWFLSKTSYKYIWNISGTIRTINDRSGILSCLMFKDFNTLGHICATYLDSHGYGAAEVMRIILALSKLTIEGFIVRAEGCGMLIIELEWFWDLE